MTKAQPYNVVLVDGGFVDGAATKLVLAAQDRPATLVGHSCGGVVITEAGNDPKVAALVYVAAFAPDQGRVSVRPHKDPPSRRACATDLAAAERLSISPQG
jgi:pimeloyl-ACP methyl ester carboxylesterase